MVERIRKQWGMTQDVFGELCGISGRYISAIERGRNEPPLSTMMEIRRIIDLGKEGAIRDKKSRDKRSVRNDGSGDCTALIHSIASSGASVTIDDFLWLMELQQTLPVAIASDLVKGLLENRHQLKK